MKTVGEHKCKNECECKITSLKERDGWPGYRYPKKKDKKWISFVAMWYF